MYLNHNNCEKGTLKLWLTVTLDVFKWLSHVG